MSENIIKISTGAKRYELQDADGEVIGKFKFNPSDVGIIERYEKVADWFNAIEIGEEFGLPEAIDLSNGIKEQFDYLFGYPVSTGLFTKCNPLSPTENGDFFFEVVVDALVSVVSKETDMRMDKKIKRIQKAVAKYQPQDHKKKAK